MTVARPDIALKPALADWLVLASLVFIWGSGFAGLKLVAEEASGLWIAALRLVVAAVALAAALPLMGQKFPPLRDGPVWRAYSVIGIFGMALPFFLFAWAAHTTDSAILAICNGAAPIATAVLAHLFLAGDKITGARAAGVGLGFLGLVALVAPKLAGGVDAATLGVLAALLGAFFYAVGAVVTRQAPTPASATAGALITCVAGGGVTLAFALASGPMPTLSAQGWAIIIALGVFPTALGTVAWVWLIGRRGPLFVSLVTYLSPLWATFLGVTLLAERLSPWAFVALGLILAGVAVANRR